MRCDINKYFTLNILNPEAKRGNIYKKGPLTERPNYHIFYGAALHLNRKRGNPFMRQCLVCLGLMLTLVSGPAFAGEIKDIVLRDGSVISGEVISLNKGIYTIKSDILGTITIEESRIQAIQNKTSREENLSLSKNNSATGEIQSLQTKMMNDKEIMNLIQSLQNDPEFKKLLEDPATMKAVQSGDVAALTANPQFMKLLSNPTVQEIQKRVK